MASQAAVPHNTPARSTWTAEQIVVAVYYSCFGVNEESIKILLQFKFRTSFTQEEVHNNLEMVANDLQITFGSDMSRSHRRTAGTYLASIMPEKEVFERLTDWSENEQWLFEVCVTLAWCSYISWSLQISKQVRPFRTSLAGILGTMMLRKLILVSNQATAAGLNSPFHEDFTYCATRERTVLRSTGLDWGADTILLSKERVYKIMLCGSILNYWFMVLWIRDKCLLWPFAHDRFYVSWCVCSSSLSSIMNVVWSLKTRAVCENEADDTATDMASCLPPQSSSNNEASCNSP